MSPPVKVRIQPYVSAELAQRLGAYVARRNFTESAVVERALREHLDGISDTALLYQRLDRINRSVQGVDGTLSILVELVNQFVKLWLRNTPPLPAADSHANRLPAEDRYKKLIGRLTAAVSAGRTLLFDLPRDDLDPVAARGQEPNAASAERPASAAQSATRALAD
jgi:hypothetical protein